MELWNYPHIIRVYLHWILNTNVTCIFSNSVNVIRPTKVKGTEMRIGSPKLCRLPLFCHRNWRVTVSHPMTWRSVTGYRLWAVYKLDMTKMVTWYSRETWHERYCWRFSLCWWLDCQLGVSLSFKPKNSRHDRKSIYLLYGFMRLVWGWSNVPSLESLCFSKKSMVHIIQLAKYEKPQNPFVYLCTRQRTGWVYWNSLVTYVFTNTLKKHIIKTKCIQNLGLTWRE